MQPSFETILFVFRRDLRLFDNRGLAEATRRARRVIPVFVFDSNILGDLEDRADRRVTFIHDAVTEVKDALRQRGSDLVVLHGDPVHVLPAVAEKTGAEAVFVNEDYEPYAKVRDDALATALVDTGRAFHAFKDHVIYARDEILNREGTPYKVFTPYRRAWLAQLADEERLGLSPVVAESLNASNLAARASLRGRSDPWTLRDLDFIRAELWLASGEIAGRRRLERFLPSLQWYEEDRDYPSREGTSALSAHLRFGTVSIRECVRSARESGEKGAQTWLSELIWREFYQMLLDRFPHVVNHSFKLEYDGIAWPGGDSEFHAWCEGRTGYPIVDAAMRHFNATGWMHNRLRMITAMFLTKDLLVDWRRGERYFAKGLLDYDLAANNGGWQWSASTGADGVPYFRIFNPTLQSRKFDPDGSFIRAHLPELAGFDDKLVHWPHDADAVAQKAAGCRLGTDYP
ncbi:MAG: deoxyribodipyrimidine photo-lyase, partial [Bacteroidota bacterium]|nr:deoxyribodipyrimidine photo-lyase [Bacteroidota bacterium]